MTNWTKFTREEQEQLIRERVFNRVVALNSRGIYKGQNAKYEDAESWWENRWDDIVSAYESI